MRQEGQIQLPGHILNQLRTNEESGTYRKDPRFQKRNRNAVSRKERRKEERRAKKHKPDLKKGPIAKFNDAKRKKEEFRTGQKKPQTAEPSKASVKETSDDPMAALRALKGDRKETKVRVLKEDELSDSESEHSEGEDSDISGLEEFGGFESSEILESDSELDYDDFDINDDDIEEKDPLAALAALKKKKLEKAKTDGKSELQLNGKKAKSHDSIEAEFVDSLDNDLEFYAKKLGIKGKEKLPDGEEDGLADIMDGIGEESHSEPSVSDSDESSEFDSEMVSDEEQENPYVAPVPKEEKPSGYVPPALRKKEDAELSELVRAIKGPLNKLSESNISSIVNDINGLFLNHPRQTVIEHFTKTILDSVVSQGRLLDTFVYLHAALVAALHRLQGVDFGAHFIQTLVERLDKTADQKEAENTVTFLTAIYAFQVVSSKLLFDLIREKVDALSENNAGIILKIVRGSGNQIRSDDPSALREIILSVTAKSNTVEMSPRMQFLVETISSLKNNKLKDESSHQLLIRLKKFLGQHISSNNDPIQVSLLDIRNIEEKGKWWLVGSAWKGSEPEVNKKVMDEILDLEPNWVEIAKKQRMNTDIRRAIFVSIMSASDYIDAVTRIDKLALKKAQEREIPRIVVHCAMMEPAWNPYYGHLAAKLCDTHSHRKTFQFMLWDVLKGEEFADEGVQKTLHLGRLFGWLLAKGSLALHVLKVVNFVALSSLERLLVEIMLITFLEHVAKKSKKQAVGVASNKMAETAYDDRILIERLIKAKEQTSLLQGLQYFAPSILDSGFLSDGKQRSRVEWGVKAMGDVIEELVREAAS